MRDFIAIILLVFLVGCTSPSSENQIVNLKLIETSDVHGNFFSYHFVDQSEREGGLARVACYVNKLRRTYGTNLLLVDNGDILQGQAMNYYFNYVDTTSVHFCADVMNYMGYDVGNMGNHDIETGHAVYERWVKQCDFPVLGANIIRTTDGKPYFQPYTILEREGVRIAILGLITPAVPAWLYEPLWAGMTFEDMEESARKWMKIIKKKEKPDIIIGLFHAGNEGNVLMDLYNDNASQEVAERVSGFDIILAGHDHKLYCEKIVNIAGDTVLLVNPGNDAYNLGEINIDVILKGGKVQSKQIEGQIVSLEMHKFCKEFIHKYSEQYNTVEEFFRNKIGLSTQKMDSRSAYFGSSALVDLIHTVQLETTGADISFASPLVYDISIPAGDLIIRDVLNFYKYRNSLYIMTLSGEEVKAVLEKSYSGWVNQMEGPNDHLLLLQKDKDGKWTLQNRHFLFDSAAGISYTVDVTKPEGEKIDIISMSDGTSFELNKNYKVALPSYRGNGGGELLIHGLNVTQHELKQRVLDIVPSNIAYYIVEYIKSKGVINPEPLNHWKFVPENWARQAAYRDSIALFGKN